jgi:hypothetical protein
MVESTDSETSTQSVVSVECNELLEPEYYYESADVKEMQNFLRFAMNKDPQVTVNDTRGILLSRINRYTNLSKKDIWLTSYIGRGVHGIVFGGIIGSTRTECAVKLVYLNDHAAEMDFDMEVHMHKLMKSKIPEHVPELYDAYHVDHYGRMIGVMIMEKVTHLLHNEMIKHQNNREFVEMVAWNISSLIALLKSHNLVHGDLHFGNIAINVKKNGVCKMQLIDFGYSFVGNVHIDLFMLWRASMDSSCAFAHSLNNAFHSIGMPGSLLVGTALGNNITRPVFGTHDHQKLYDCAGDLLDTCKSFAQQQYIYASERTFAQPHRE